MHFQGSPQYAVLWLYIRGELIEIFLHGLVSVAMSVAAVVQVFHSIVCTSFLCSSLAHP